MSAIVVRTGALGDFVATLPVLHRLATDGPVVVLTQPRYRALVPFQILDVEGPEAARIFAGTADLTSYALAISWTATGASALRACGAPEVLEGAPRPAPGTPICDHLWSPLAARLGPRDRNPVVTPDASAVAQIDARLAGRRPVVISPGSGGPAKQAPIAWWREVAARVPDALWVGGPLETDHEPWAASCWDDLDLTGLAALATRCRAWVCPDSGPGHLAAAAGARVGVVFTGATDPSTWAPPGAQVFDLGSPDVVATWAVSTR